ncbi:MAG: hypothetical protein ACMXYL_05570 [Candidatus Woesearchaeota archaeon]
MALQDKKAGMIRRQKKEKMRRIILYSSLFIVVGSLIVFGFISATTPGELDDFAQCISDSGAIFYGTSWCPDCQQQKDLFQKSQRLLPYVECSGMGRQSISPECGNLNITRVPTWEYNNTRFEGRQSLAQLSDMTGCEIA